MTSTPTTELRINDSKTVTLTSTGREAVEQIVVTRRPNGYEVTMQRRNGYRVLESEHRTFGNAFATYAEAAAYANDWIRRSGRTVAR